MAKAKKGKKGKRYERDGVEFDEDMALGGKVRGGRLHKGRKRGRTAVPVGGRASKGRATIPVLGRAGDRERGGGRTIPGAGPLGGMRNIGGESGPQQRIEQDNGILGKLREIMGGDMGRMGFKKGGKVSGGYAVHGESGKYKVGE